ncbi:MAG: hypothetical protein KJZ83_10530, partial [Burkholderiaceae bacterium]|nr:hypothetical protein [Burkholderiaceae bacterium]
MRRPSAGTGVDASDAPGKLTGLVGAIRAPGGVSLAVRVIDEETRHLAVVSGVVQPRRSACDRG